MLIKAEDYKNGMKFEKGVLYNGKDGTYRYADNKLYSAVIKVPTPYGGDEIKEQIIEIKLPKIPFELFNKIHEFFKHIYKEYKSEVAILLWYNFETDVWEVEVPKQTVSGSSVNYRRDENWVNEMNQKGFFCVGSIHSHCEMSAFHSGTDDADEYNFDGVHITIGKVISGPQFAQRFIVKQMSKKFDKISDVVDYPEEDETDKYPSNWFGQVKKSYAPTYGKNSGYGRQPSIFGGKKQKRTTNMKFNSDGSLRVPWETDEETTETQEEITKEEKEKRATEHYIGERDVFRCPVCFEDIPPNQLSKDWICPECGFPMWENELDYELDYVKNKKTGKEETVALKETYDDYDIEDLADKAVNEDLKRFINQDDYKYSL